LIRAGTINNEDNRRYVSKWFDFMVKQVKDNLFFLFYFVFLVFSIFFFLKKRLALDLIQGIPCSLFFKIIELLLKRWWQELTLMQLLNY